jgi:hypothetical protein
MLILAIAALALVGPAWGEPAAPRAAGTVDMADLLYTARAVVVFAPALQDPRYVQQMELLAQDRGELAARDVVVIVDTDPAAKSAVRSLLRPSGFAVVIIDKDGKTAQRKPRPTSLREITRIIDSLPSRRGELLDLLPAGR